MPSIKDVAKKAGVSITTVSRAMNNTDYVKKETREKIEKAIKEIGYVPNEIARSMTLQKSNLVAFVLPNCSYLFFASLLYHVENELNKYGYKTIICNSNDSYDLEKEYLDMLKNNRVDSVILLTKSTIEEHIDKSLPIISFDRRLEGIPYVASDNFEGGVLAAKELINKGCKNMMFLGDDAQGDSPVQSEVNKRRSGFIDYLRSKGYDNVINVEYHFEDQVLVPEDAKKLLFDHPEVDGIFCMQDSIAIEVIKLLEANGRRVPEDVKVIGYDGGMSYHNLGKELTSVEQPMELIAVAIREGIVAMSKKEPVPNKIVPVRLKIGETT